MERHQIIEAMTSLKLYGMRASFDEIAGKGLNRREELYPLLASLIRAEVTHRQSRSINYRISGARFPMLKDLDAFVFDDTPVDEGQIRELAGGDFIEAKRNLILIGGTEERGVHRGDPFEHRDLLSGNRFQHPSGIESRYQHQGGARGHR